MHNPAEWATKPRKVNDLKSEGFWQQGPKFLEEDYKNWPIRLDFKSEMLEGELQPKGVNVMLVITNDMMPRLNVLLDRFSSSFKLYRTTSYLFKWLNKRKRFVRNFTYNSAKEGRTFLDQIVSTGNFTGFGSISFCRSYGERKSTWQVQKISTIYGY